MHGAIKIGLVLVVGSAALAAGPRDKLDEYLKAAGPAYRNCGTAEIGGKNRAQVDDCVLKSFTDGKAFVVRYDLQGIDSNVAQALWFTPEKQLTVVGFDDYECAARYCTQPQLCSEPRITKTTKGIHVHCTNDYDL